MQRPAHILSSTARSAGLPSSLRFRTKALESALHAVVITDKTGKMTWANSAFTGLTGYGVNEAVGQNLRILKSGRQDLAFYQNFWKTILSGGVWTGEMVNRCKNGRLYTEQMTVAPISDDQGQITHFISIKQDISERKQADEALRASHRQLDQELAQLKVAQKRVVEQERLHALGQMAGGFAHNFNNALAPILGLSELLLHHPGKSRDPKVLADILKVINSSAREATLVVRQLREFYRHREGGEVFLPVDMNKLVTGTVALVQSRWPKREPGTGNIIEVKVELGDVPIIEGDEPDLVAMLTHLMDNAADAMPAGGTMTIRSQAHNGRIQMEVADTGAGMTEADRQRCLEPFFSTKGRRSAGLGLSMAYGVIKRHDGSLEIRSKSGLGTTIAMQFPVEIPLPTPVSKMKVDVSIRPLRILLVEDEHMILDVLFDDLAGDGHSVASANGVDQSLAKLARAKFDLVITDRSLPGSQGGQLAAVIKARQPGVPVIMLTGFGVDAATDCPIGVDCLLRLPITLEALRAALSQACPVQSQSAERKESKP